MAESVSTFWTLMNSNAGALGLLVAGVPLIWAAWQYLWQKRQELRSQRFETYHRLIKQLVEREKEEQPKMLDRQLAVVFELRRFHEYHEPSLRILKGLRDGWKDNYGPQDKRKRLIDEMDVTISYIQSKYDRKFRSFSRFVRSL